MGITLCSLVLLGIVTPQTVVAQTRTFKFHMNTQYAHGQKPNNGYVASKADDEQKAYVTMTQFSKSSGSPTISMYVTPSSGFRQVTTAYSWTGTASTKKLDYYETGRAGSSYKLCAEQFGNGAVVIGGRWTP